MAEGRLEWFAVTAPGLEEVTAAELRDLRLRAPRVVPGGVTFRGTMIEGLRANLWLRTATRVLLRRAAYGARGLADLERGARRLPWEAWLPTGVPVWVQAHATRSRIYHTGAAAERVARVLARALRLEPAETRSDRLLLLPRAGEVARAPGAAPAGSVGDEGAGLRAQRVRVRVHRDRVTVSLDASGERLHRRGYRLETAKAPLRETVAAALLRAAGYRGQCPLWDPLAGSGTLVIEAAWIAARRAPGRFRTFAMEQWPGLDPGVRPQLDAEADARLRPITVPVGGSDRDPGAVAAARRNASRASVGHQVTIRRATLSECVLDAPAGLLATNPPYGKRIGNPAALTPLYQTLGELVRRAPGEWRLALVTGSLQLARATGLALVPLTPPVAAGGLALHLLTGPGAGDAPRAARGPT